MSKLISEGERETNNLSGKKNIHRVTINRRLNGIRESTLLYK